MLCNRVSHIFGQNCTTSAAQPVSSLTSSALAALVFAILCLSKRAVLQLSSYFVFFLFPKTRGKQRGATAVCDRSKGSEATGGAEPAHLLWFLLITIIQNSMCVTGAEAARQQVEGSLPIWLLSCTAPSTDRPPCASGVLTPAPQLNPRAWASPQ